MGVADVAGVVVKIGCVGRLSVEVTGCVSGRLVRGDTGVAGLSRGQDEGRWHLGLRGDRHRTWCEERRQVASARATIVRSEGRQDGVGVAGSDAEQVLAEEFILARQGNSRGPHALLVQGIPIGRDGLARASLALSQTSAVAGPELA